MPIVTATSTPAPAGGVVPSGKTPGPTKQVAPEERVPGTAEALPGAGSGSVVGASRGGLWLLIAALAFVGWFIVTWMLYRREGQFSKQPLRAENARGDSPRGRAP